MSSEKFYNNYIKNSYNQPLSTQDEEVQYFDYFLKNFSNVLPEDKTSPVLDIGIGNGRTLRAFRKLGYKNYLGVDIAKELVEKAHEEGLACEYIENTNIFLNSHKNKFSFIFLSHVVEHIPKEELSIFLERIKESLTSNGILVIVTPSVQNLFYLGSFWDFTHVNFFTERSLYQVCEAGGFEKILMLPEKTPINIYGNGPINFVRFLTSDLIIRIVRWGVVLILRGIRFGIGTLNPKILSFNIVCICKKL